MAKRGKRRDAHRSDTAQGARRGAAASADPDAVSDQAVLDDLQVMLGELRQVIDAGGTDILICLSAILEAVTEEPVHEASGMPMTLPNLVDSLIALDYAETTTALHVLAALTTDDVLRRRIRRAVADRRHPVPPLVRELDSTRPTRAVAMRDARGDATNVLLEIAWPDGARECAVILVDHNLEDSVTDGFMAPADLDVLLEHFAGTSEASLISVDDLPLDEARALLEPAFVVVDSFGPLVERGEEEMWPQSRHLLGWLVSLLPKSPQRTAAASGLGEPAPPELDALLADFFASPHARGLDPTPMREDADIAETLLVFGSGTGDGDPLRWSPMRAEHLLVDWLPANIIADLQWHDRLPDVLGPLVAYCDERRDIPLDDREAMQEALRSFAPIYRQMARDAAGPGTVDALFSALVSGGIRSSEEYLYDDLARRVGGIEALDSLDRVPLPAEELDLSGVPDDVHARVQRVAALLEPLVESEFGVELRTACRRFLGAVAAADPAIFRRRSRDDTAAAAVVWAVARANRLIGEPGTPTVGSVLERLGVGGSVSQRAEPMLRALGAGDQGLYDRPMYERPVLGDPRLLVSAERDSIIEERDACRRTLAELEADEDDA